MYAKHLKKNNLFKFYFLNTYMHCDGNISLLKTKTVQSKHMMLQESQKRMLGKSLTWTVVHAASWLEL